MIHSSDLKPGKLFRTKSDLVGWHLPTHNPIDKSVKVPCGDLLFVVNVNNEFGSHPATYVDMLIKNGVILYFWASSYFLIALEKV